MQNSFLHTRKLIDHENSRRYYYNYNLHRFVISGGWQVLCEYNGSDEFQQWYAYGNYIDEVLAMGSGIFASTARFYIHDHLYSPIALTDYSGNVLERYEYDAYGSPTIWNADFTTERESSNYSNTYLFTGRRADYLDSGSLKIQYNRNRYYDYYTGRWLTHDPLAMVPNLQALNYFKPDNQYLQGLSLYEYISSNPTIGIDPWGLVAYEKNGPLPPWPSNIAMKEGPNWLVSVLPSFPWPVGSATTVTLKTIWRGGWLLHKFFWLAGWRDGARHINLYLKSQGGPGQIADYSRMLRDSKKAREWFVDELHDAQVSAEALITGDESTEPTQITRIKCKGHGKKAKEIEDWNWYVAINKHYTWGRGYVRKGKARQNCCYYMDLTVHIRDRFDFAWFNPLSWLELAGWAESFRVIGRHKVSVTWIKGYSFKEQGVDTLDLINGRQPVFPQCP